MQNNYKFADGLLQIEIGIDLRTSGWGDKYLRQIKNFPAIDPGEWEWYRTDVNSDWGAGETAVMFTLKKDHSDVKLAKLIKALTPYYMNDRKIVYDARNIDLGDGCRIANIRINVPRTTTNA